jgi:hypothetical protein
MSDYLGTGIHADIPPDRYHADPCEQPSLSHSIAHLLLTRSPAHARTAHPRLNPAHQEKDANGAMDFGTAAHALLLQGLDVCHIVDGFTDWKKQVARDERDQARAEGLVPLLRKDWDSMCAFCESVRAQLREFDIRPRPLTDGLPEQTLIWQEDGIWCRARADWLHNSERHIDDLKTTGTSANPYVWARNRLFADGKDVQAAHYLAGLRAVTGRRGDWRFIVAETDPPYAVSVISLAPDALELAERKRARALELWKRCLETGEWPAYARQVAYAEAPGWAEADFLEQHWEDSEVVA